MQHTLTIAIDEEVYQALRERVGQDDIGRFIEELVRPHLLTEADLEAGYRAMAEDTAREEEAHAWSEGLVGETLP